jgi:TP901 family phage tail tape measure protein
VGATYGVLSAALMTIPAATAAVAAAYQKDFAQVIRVNDELQGPQNSGAAQALKDSLKTMATDMPIAFSELSRITQLGAQMGVANDKLAQFTETTAKFVAVTGISADTGATLFGRMESSFTPDVEKYPDYFERLGSSIARVGADTVATDPEIASMLSQIGPLGAAAGMSSANVTGLAAALASVRVQPELARGTLTRVFGQLNRDVAEGSPKMAEFGKLMNLTGDQASKLWKTDSSKFFTQMIEGLNKVQNTKGELTTTFDKLGISASRDVSALTKLAVGYDVLDLSMKSANKGFTEGTALNTMSKISFDTVIAKLTEMVNAWKNLGDTLGGGALAPMAIFVDMAKNLALGIDGLVKKAPFIGGLLSVLMGIAAVTAMFLGFKAAQAFVMAGMIGFQQAAARGMGGGLALGNTVRTLAQTMLMAKGATEAQSRALLGQVGAMRALMIASSTSTSSLNSLANSHVGVATGFSRITVGAGRFSSALVGMAGGPVGIAVAALALLAGHLLSTSIEAETAGKAIADALAQGADAGMREIARTLSEKKVQLGDGIMIGNVDKKLTQIAEEVGIPFDKMVSAVAKGKAGVKDFDKVLEDFAVSKGYKSLQDMSLKNPGSLGGDGAVRAKLEYLRKNTDELANAQDGSAKSTTVANEALTKLGVPLSAVGDEGEQTATSIEKMTDALKALNDEVFGTINAEADLQDSLSKMGEGLQKSSQFTPNSEGGRANLKNLQDTLSKSRDYFKQSVDDQTMTAQEAAQGYSDFVAGLMSKIQALGGDTSGIETLANNTKDKFQAAIGGAPVALPVEADGTKFKDDARLLAGTPLSATLMVGMDKSNADANMQLLARNIAQITGMPYEVVMDALTNPASDKAKDVEALIVSITNGTYVASVDADTSAAVANVQNFLAFARTELSHLQTELNGGVGYGDGEGSLGTAQKAQYAAIAAPTQVRSTPKANGAAAAPAPTVPSGLAPGLDGLADGYKKAGDAAQKAGDKGKKAGEDMADGIDEATKAAEDYGNRLKTAMMSAYNQQYGLTKATDEYHTALNAITKKRDDELAQIEDLKTKVKELNNERNKELITAAKAKIEADISAKYGEGARQADYESQVQTALDNAAAKKKDIDATSLQAKTVQEGIGNFEGYSDAAIANREALRGLESKMIDMISAYAATGASQESVRAYAQRLTAQFKTDAGQVWNNRVQIDGLVGDMGRYVSAVNNVPRVKPTTVTADTGQAMGAIGGVQNALNSLRDKDVTVRWKMTSTVREVPGYQFQGQQVWQVLDENGNGTGKKFFNRGGQVPGFADGGQIPGTAPSDPSVDNLMAQVDGKGMIRVRSNEFIQPEPAVDYYGLDFMNAIRTMSLPKFNMGGSVGGGSTSSGSFGNGPTSVQLSAENIAAIQRAGDRPVILFADSTQLATSVNAGNVILAQTGAS